MKTLKDVVWDNIRQNIKMPDYYTRCLNRWRKLDAEFRNALPPELLEAYFELSINKDYLQDEAEKIMFENGYSKGRELMKNSHSELCKEIE